ncbi:MAG: 1-acyl-sn-glycerol-3-phosphate acyltransferase [Armatimonadetes bacterium]|nr:1-acyl-sn-glycerol-3-phosphate acyltransferase [Akkermansiaceae bacterium]
MSWFTLRLLPADFLRLVCLGATRTLYRIKFANTSRLPKTGGVLLLPNHVTFADAFFISAACDRPVRFVMDETFMANRAIQLSAKLFGTVPIRRDQPLEAIRKIIEALENGDVVALFPEGQLTRTGALCELERGFELIARKANAPIFPLWIDGAWGSIFSFERGRFFKKIPYRIPFGLAISIGEQITTDRVNRGDAQLGLMKASSEAIARRFEGRAIPETINGYQITQLNALHRGGTFHVLGEDSEMKAISGVLEEFARQTGGAIKQMDSFQATHGRVWPGGGKLREQISSALFTTQEIHFYDFSELALTPLENDGLIHLPCLAINGTVISLSMPHPMNLGDLSLFQAGHKTHSRGKILPGFYLQNGFVLPGRFPLPENTSLDNEGFLIHQDPE